MVRAPTGFAFHSVVRAATDERWRVIDSGANHHLTGELSLIDGTLAPTSLRIAGISGGLHATGVGKGIIMIAGVTFILPRLYFVPGLATSLISMSELVEANCTIATQKVRGVHEMRITNPAGHVATIHPTNGMYQCNPTRTLVPPPTTHPSIDTQASAFLSLEGVNVGRTHVGPLSLGEVLHRRLGHHSWSSKPFTERVRAATGKKNLGEGHSVASCHACARTRIRQQFTRTSPTRPATRPLERVHFDFVPRVAVLGVGGFVGFVLLVDQFTDNFFLYPIRSKSEILPILDSFKKQAERHFRIRMAKFLWPFEIGSIRSDGEAVNVSTTIKTWCLQHGILQELSAPYCQWQNGIVEKAIQGVWQGGQTLRLASGASESWWVFAVLAYVHTRNLLAMGAHALSPWERWWGISVPLLTRIEKLRTWGCLCYKHIPTALRGKLQEKGEPSIMMGYSSTSKAYLVRSISTGVVSTSANVIFNEAVFPMLHHSASNHIASHSLPTDYFSAFDHLDTPHDSDGLPPATMHTTMSTAPGAVQFPPSTNPPDTHLEHEPEATLPPAEPHLPPESPTSTPTPAAQAMPHLDPPAPRPTRPTAGLRKSTRMLQLKPVPLTTATRKSTRMRWAKKPTDATLPAPVVPPNTAARSAQAGHMSTHHHEQVMQQARDQVMTLSNPSPPP